MDRCFALRLVAPVLVALGILGRALPTSADNALPFQGRADAVVTGIEEVEEGLLLTVAATGEATYLGRFLRDEWVLLRADGTFQASLVFTAANGDQLFAEGWGAFTSGTTAEGTYTFAGGTGRFQDASGDADFEAVTPDGIHVALTFVGTIEL